MVVMIAKGIRTAALAAAPFALIAAGATPAAAAAETQSFRYSNCVEWEQDGTQLCFQGEGRVHVSYTKSGNENIVLRAVFFEQLIGPDGEVLDSHTAEEKAHSLIKQGEGHVFTLKSEGVSSVDGQTCPFTVHVHYANGQARVERVDAGCLD